jgi:hypothetical protein
MGDLENELRIQLSKKLYSQLKNELHRGGLENELYNLLYWENYDEIKNELNVLIE